MGLLGGGRGTCLKEKMGRIPRFARRIRARRSSGRGKGEEGLRDRKRGETNWKKSGKETGEAGPTRVIVADISKKGGAAIF